MSDARVAVVRRAIGDARTRTISFALMFFAVVWSNAAGYRSTYPHASDRAKLVAGFADNKAARMLYGTGHALTTVGGYTAWRAGGLLVLFAGLFGIFAAARAMRGEEDDGRAEIVLAGALTRTGAFTGGLLAIGVTVAVLFAATALGAVAGGLSLAPSCFLALAVASVAAVYAGVGAVTNQVLPTRRGALGVAGALLGTDFVVRIVADTTDHPVVHWFTPLGWAEEMRAFSGTRAAVLLLPAVFVGALVVTAARLRNGRDLGRGYVAARDTAEPRTRLLTSPFALAFRLDRVTIMAWAGGVAAFAVVVGTVAKSVEKLSLSESLRRQLSKLGGIDITRAKGYVGLSFIIFDFAIALFVCGQLSAVREEESSHRLETLFALPHARERWLAGRALLVFGGVVLCALLAGAAAGVGVLVTGGHMTFVQGLAGGVNIVPVEVLFLGSGMLAYAVVPRHGVGLLYAFVAIAFVWELFGALLGFPHAVLDLSPFHHIAPTPARPIAVPAALAMAGTGIVAGALALRAFSARDLTGD